MPRVIISIDGVVLKELPLAKDRTTLGRRPYNDIVIDNLAVSGEHAALHWNGSEVSLEDLRSTNGTYVNAQPVTKQTLQHNDVVEIGKYRIRYLTTARSAGGATGSASTLGPLSELGGTFTAPVPLGASSVPGALGGVTLPMPLGASAAQAVIKVLSGPGAGRDIELQKVVTTFGKPGVAVAAVTRRLRGYAVTPVDGATLLNKVLLGADAVVLHHGDVLELAATQMRFELA